MDHAPAANARRGLACALVAFGTWGIVPLYWKSFAGIPAIEVIAHRLCWAVPVLLVLVALFRQLPECRAVVRQPRLLGMLLLTAALLSLNWAVFVYSVGTNQIVEASLGYFINPLVSVLFGCLVLRERLSRGQLIAVALAAIGVAVYGWNLWRVPWIALTLALSFGAYGLFRKMVPVGPLPGLLVETTLMAPVALGFLLWLESVDRGAFPGNPGLAWLFVSAGVITVIPLVFFNAAAKLLPLSTLGFLQYLAPTLQLLCGVAIYGERFTLRDAAAFTLIWAGILLFLTQSRRR